MALTTERLVRESVPIAAIVSFWGVLTLVMGVSPDNRDSVAFAGAIMGGLYAVLRGLALADDAAPATAEPVPEEALRDSVRALFGAGPWFLAAILLASLTPLLTASLPFETGYMWDLAHFVAGLLAWTGTGTVLLFAVATGYASVREDRPIGTGSPSNAPDDAGAVTED